VLDFILVLLLEYLQLADFFNEGYIKLDQCACTLMVIFTPF